MQNKLVIKYYLPHTVLVVRNVKNKIKIKKNKQQQTIVLTN